MIGAPGAGKSYYTEQLNVEIISTDAIRGEINKDENDQSNGYLVFKTAYKRMRKLLYEGKDVVFDATNVTRKARKKVMKNALKGTEFIAVFVDTPLETCIKQNKERPRQVKDDVIESFYNRLEKPTLEEGFSEIIVKKRD
jgi:predicted kinase